VVDLNKMEVFAGGGLRVVELPPTGWELGAAVHQGERAAPKSLEIEQKEGPILGCMGMRLRGRSGSFDRFTPRRGCAAHGELCGTRGWSGRFVSGERGGDGGAVWDPDETCFRKNAF